MLVNITRHNERYYNAILALIMTDLQWNSCDAQYITKYGVTAISPILALTIDIHKKSFL